MGIHTFKIKQQIDKLKRKGNLSSIEAILVGIDFFEALHIENPQIPINECRTTKSKFLIFDNVVIRKCDLFTGDTLVPYVHPDKQH